MAKKYGDNKLSKMCKMIAGDENTIMLIASLSIGFFRLTLVKMMIAFQYMMKQKSLCQRILRESGQKISTRRTVF
jgi:acyl-[acyl-carrier-protein] desaturase